MISLTRLPVDLLPDISQPTISVRVNYTGVGPLEIEELITRPLEQQLSAVSGLEQMNSTSSEGNSNIQMNFTWGHDLNEAMDDIRTRIDRVRGRLPEDADPPVIQKFDSNAAPIMGLAVESVDGTLDRVQLRELVREPAVAASRARLGRRGRDRQRRSAPPDSRRSARARRSRRSTCRSIASSTSSAPRTRTFRSARSIRATGRCCCAARASSSRWIRSATSW